MEFNSEKKINEFINPLDSIEDIIYRYDLDFLRDTPNDLSINYKGLWKNYNVSFRWDEFNKIIRISSYLEISKKKKINNNIFSLVSLINKKVALGYFDFCSKTETVFFNYKVSIRGIKILTTEQIEDFLDVVVSECDRFFPVFYIFLNKKQDPNYALKAALFETYGEA